MTKFSLNDIRALNDDAARRAYERHFEPYVVTEVDLKVWAIAPCFPFRQLGGYLPEGWGRVSLEDEALDHGVYLGDNDGFGAYFVDASGFGHRGEPALTIKEFLDKLEVGYGYAIVEAGRFQVKIGKFCKVN